jgi:hypothetical protein
MKTASATSLVLFIVSTLAFTNAWLAGGDGRFVSIASATPNPTINTNSETPIFFNT